MLVLRQTSHACATRVAAASPSASFNPATGAALIGCGGFSAGNANLRRRGIFQSPLSPIDEAFEKFGRCCGVAGGHPMSWDNRCTAISGAMHATPNRCITQVGNSARTSSRT
jgi:hypothetical protein